VRTAAKTDENQTEIVEVARSLHASVALTHQLGKGFPDLVVGLLGTVNLLWEIKTEQGELNEREKRFHTGWRGQIKVVRSAEEAEREILLWREIVQQLRGLERDDA